MLFILSSPGQSRGTKRTVLAGAIVLDAEARAGECGGFGEYGAADK